jgi:WD40 repeat protein
MRARRLASASADKTVRVWRVSDGSLARTLVGHGGGVSDCAWSERSDYLATASDDKTVGLWEVATGRLVRSFVGHTAYVFCVNFNAHSNQLVRALPMRVCLLRMASPRALLSRKCAAQRSAGCAVAAPAFGVFAFAFAALPRATAPP